MIYFIRKSIIIYKIIIMYKILWKKQLYIDVNTNIMFNKNVFLNPYIFNFSELVQIYTISMCKKRTFTYSYDAPPLKKIIYSKMNSYDYSSNVPLLTSTIECNNIKNNNCEEKEQNIETCETSYISDSSDSSDANDANNTIKSIQPIEKNIKLVDNKLLSRVINQFEKIILYNVSKECINYEERIEIFNSLNIIDENKDTKKISNILHIALKNNKDIDYAYIYIIIVYLYYALVLVEPCDGDYLYITDIYKWFKINTNDYEIICNTIFNICGSDQEYASEIRCILFNIKRV